MPTTLRSGPARAATALAAAALALGLAAAPSVGADGEVSGETPQRFDQVQDPRGDTAVYPEATPKPGADRRLADLTRVRYRTPSTTGGDLRIVARWNLLRDGSKAGARKQVLSTFVQTGIPRDVIEVRVNNINDRVRISDPTVQGSPSSSPEKVVVDRTFGRDGRTDVLISTEWLGGRNRIFLTSSARSVGYYDNTKPSDDLDVGSPR